MNEISAVLLNLEAQRRDDFRQRERDRRAAKQCRPEGGAHETVASTGLDNSHDAGLRPHNQTRQRRSYVPPRPVLSESDSDYESSLTNVPET